jgi:antitoxin ParD1/3/4
MSDSPIDLSEDLKRFVQKEIVTGRFTTPREVIEAGLALLAEREGRLAALRSVMEENERPSFVPRRSEVA